MSKANFATIPVHCATCGQQTHKTRESIEQSGGLVCACGAFTRLDVKEFGKEIDKAEANIKDFGVDG
jgi:hypothetical protein